MKLSKCYSLLIVICLSAISRGNASVEVNSSKQNNKPYKKSMISKQPKKIKEIEPIKHFEDGKEGKEAEIAHFTQRWGFVDYLREYGPDTIMLIKSYFSMKKDHYIEAKSFYKHFFEDVELTVDNTESFKTKLCQRSLNEPLLKDNKIYFDKEVDVSLIKFKRKRAVFLFYEKKPTKAPTIQCPVLVDGEEGYFLYITPFENAENEEEDNYFIMMDFLYENEEFETDEVIIMMRTRLGQKSTWTQLLENWLPISALKKFIVED